MIPSSPRLLRRPARVLADGGDSQRLIDGSLQAELDLIAGAGPCAD